MIPENQKYYMTLQLKWSSTPLKWKNQDLHDLFLETFFWIHFKTQFIFGSPTLNMSFLQTALVDKLVHGRSLHMQKYQQVWEKNEILKYEVMASPL